MQMSDATILSILRDVMQHDGETQIITDDELRLCNLSATAVGSKTEPLGQVRYELQMIIKKLTSLIKQILSLQRVANTKSAQEEITKLTYYAKTLHTVLSVAFADAYGAEIRKKAGQPVRIIVDTDWTARMEPVETSPHVMVVTHDESVDPDEIARVLGAHIATTETKH
jgi:hypothetical protein